MTDAPSDDPIDDGLAEAFGKEASPHKPKSPQSVLAVLQAMASVDMRLHLDAADASDVPVKITEEAKALRDPSGRYQALGEIGRGGVGVVYKGRDQDLGRDVAMKVLKDNYAEHPDVLARFVEEAQIGGQLQHPGIVPVYELGLHAGERPYFAMKLVKGETLSAQLTRRKDTAEDRRRFYGIFEQVCQTMAYAHSRHVVHRDLKPANVMIGAFGEVQVVDWGLAKVRPKGGVDDERTDLDKAAEAAASVVETVRSKSGSGSESVVGSMLGTPAYMPPEQAVGNPDQLDQRSDVFGLGAILCQILTGDPPYRVQDGDVIRQAANGALDSAHERIRNSGADEAIVALCIECLSRNRQTRPASARELAGRVSDHLTSVEERARQAELRATEARYKQRQTLLAATAAILLLAVGGGSWWWIAENMRAQQQAATDRVSAAMIDVREALAGAQSANLERTAWETVEQHGERLATLARSETIGEDTRTTVRILLSEARSDRDIAIATIEQNERDDRMRQALVDARIPIDHDVFHDFHRKEFFRVRRAYQQAFLDYLGQPIESLSVAEAVAGLRAGSIQTELAAALDRWLLATSPSEELATHLFEVVTHLDGDDPWRNAFRRVVAKHRQGKRDADELRELVARLDLDRLPAEHCEVLCMALSSSGAREDALLLIKRAREHYPQDFALAFWHAIYIDGKPLRTYEAFEIARAIRPEHLEVLHRQGFALQTRGRHRDALRLFEPLRSRDPDHAHWHTHVAQSLHQLGQTDEAISAYRDALDRDPDEVNALNQLAALLHDAASFDEALELNQRALAVGKDLHPHFRCQVHGEIALSHLALGDLNSAERHALQAIEIGPRRADGHTVLGAIRHEQGRFAQAVTYLRRGLELDSKFAGAHGLAGHSLLMLCRPEEASREFEQELRDAPSAVLANTSLGMLAEFRGEFERALEHFTLTLEGAPNTGICHFYTASTLLALGRAELALPHFERAQQRIDGDRDAQGLENATRGLSMTRRLLSDREALTAIASGQSDGNSKEDWIAAAELARIDRDHAGALSVWQRAFMAMPELGLVGDHLRAAVIAAALAGREASDHETRERMRARAFEWISFELANCKLAEPVRPPGFPDRYYRLIQLQQRKELQALRPGPALDALPKADADRWRDLWRRIDDAATAWVTICNPGMAHAGSDDETVIRRRIAKIRPSDYRARVELVFELLDPGRPEAERHPAIALELAQHAVKQTRNVKAGPLQALAEALFANGKPDEAQSKMHRAMRARTETGDRDYSWMQQRVEEYRK